MISPFSFGEYGNDLILIKTDDYGNAVWIKTYGGPSVDEGRSVRQTSDGGYIVAGHTYSFGAGTPDYTNCWILKTDENGDTLWSRVYGGLLNDACESVIINPDNSYMIVGTTASFGAGIGDVWILKMSSDSFVVNDSRSTIVLNSIVHINLNPLSDRVNIKLSLSYNVPISIKIYNILGRLVKEFFSQSTNNITWNGTDSQNKKLHCGVYFLNVKAGEFTATEKIVIIK